MRSPVDAEPRFPVLRLEPLGSGLKRRYVVARLDTAPDSPVQLLDLTLEPVFAIDQLGPGGFVSESEPSPERP